MMGKKVFALLLSMLLLLGLSACGSADTNIPNGSSNSENADFSGDHSLDKIGEDDQNANSLDENNNESIVPDNIYIDQDEMNNYVQGSSGFAHDGSNVYFTDNFYHYTFSPENGELNRESRSSTGDYLLYDGIIVEGTVFTQRGQLLQSGNNHEGWRFCATLEIDGANRKMWPSGPVLPNGEYIYFLYDPNVMQSGGEMILRAPITRIQEIDESSSVNDKEFRCLDFGDSELVFEEDGLHDFGIYGDKIVAVTEGCDYWVIDINTGEGNLIVNGDEIKQFAGTKPFAVDGEYIYFTNDVEPRIERIRFDGTGRETVLEGVNGSFRGLFNISKGYLYHMDEGRLYRTNLADLSDQIVLAEGQEQGVSDVSNTIPCVVDDWVYYGSLGYGYWRAKTDGTCTELITYAAYSENEPQWDVETFEKHNIAAGYEHTVAIQSDGTVVATGNNDEGQCEVSDWTDIVSVYATQGTTIGIKSDGTFCSAGTMPSLYGFTNSIAYDLRFGATLAVKEDGRVVGGCTLGGGAPGNWVSEVENWTDIVAAATSASHTVGVKEDGTAIAAGDNSAGQCEVSDWTDITAVAVGSKFTVGLKSDGTVVTAGDIPELDWTDIVAISAAYGNVIGLKQDGTVITNNQILNDWSDITEVCAGGKHYVGIRSDGTVLTAGDNTFEQCNTGEWHGMRTSS